MALGWGRKTTSETHEDEEMSMDEILASIRRYVSDGHPDEENRRASETPHLAPPSEDATHRKDQAVSESLEVEEDILELKKVSGRHTVQADDSRDSALQQEVPISETPGKESALSQESREASASAFSQLMRAIPAEKELARENTEFSGTGTESMTLDRLLRELARPMIYQWLDQNLPKIVERLVAQELEKITRRL